MSGEFNFKSQICTSRSQSEKLLALGLKKETADMSWFRRSKNADWESSTTSHQEWVEEILPIVDDYTLVDIIPAWSLHRLLSLLPKEILCEVENGLGMFLDDENAVSYFGVLGYYTHDNLYDAVILCIEWLIKEGYFNKEYLV